MSIHCCGSTNGSLWLPPIEAPAVAVAQGLSCGACFALAFCTLPRVMDTTGLVQSIVLVPPTTWSATVTPSTKMLMPTLITIVWKYGQSTDILPEMLGSGQSRDVISGTLRNTGEPAPWVVKFQDWSWHGSSNGHEYGVASGVLKPFTPEMAGCVQCEYRTPARVHVLSALVAARVSGTMHAYVDRVFAAPVDISGVRLIMGLIHSLFDIIHEACKVRNVKLTDLKNGQYRC